MSSSTTAKDVLLYIPNIVGYLRIVFMCVSFFLMISVPSQWILAITLYILAFVADLFDGMAARKYNQCSSFGGLMDMLTDRCSTTGLLFVLSQEYSSLSNPTDIPSSIWSMTFLFLILLDISSHWAQTYSSALLQQHHKSSDANAQNFFLVRLYYQIYLFFGYCCVGTEFTYIALYTYARLYYHDDDNNDWIDFVYKFLLVCGPACIVKQIVNVSQLCSACHGIATNDANNKMKDS